MSLESLKIGIKNYLLELFLRNFLYRKKVIYYAKAFRPYMYISRQWNIFYSIFIIHAIMIILIF